MRFHFLTEKLSFSRGVGGSEREHCKAAGEAQFPPRTSGSNIDSTMGPGPGRTGASAQRYPQAQVLGSPVSPTRTARATRAMARPCRACAALTERAARSWAERATARTKSDLKPLRLAFALESRLLTSPPRLLLLPAVLNPLDEDTVSHHRDAAASPPPRLRRPRSPFLLARILQPPPASSRSQAGPGGPGLTAVGQAPRSCRSALPALRSSPRGPAGQAADPGLQDALRPPRIPSPPPSGPGRGGGWGHDSP